MTKLEELKELMDRIIYDPRENSMDSVIADLARGIKLLAEEVSYRQYKGY